MIERNYRRKSDKTKQYRAVVIDAHMIFRFIALIIMVAVISVFIGIGVKTLVINGSETSQNAEKKASVSETEPPKPTDEPSSEVENDSENGSKNLENLKNTFSSIIKFVMGFNPCDKTEVVRAEIPGAELVNSYEIIHKAESEKEQPSSAVPTNEPQSQDKAQGGSESEGDLEIKAINAGQNANSDTNDIKIGNHTSYSVDVNQLLSEPLTLDMSAEGPKILIVHTHATEAYAREGAKRYNSGESDRNLDITQNVVAVGDEVERIFNEHGIETLHDKQLHDHPSFNGAYADALNSIEQYLSEYPSIRIVLDLHRDSIVYDDGTKAKLLTKIDGKSAAQLMFVVGTNEKGLYNPDWHENLKFAVHLQDAIDQKYPNLMRRIDLRQERFNCHATHGSLIIEMGSSGNSLSEAKYGMACAAEVMADFINGLK